MSCNSRDFFISGAVSLTLRMASPADVAEVAALVNRAYRPSGLVQGWTHEAGLVSGPRVTPLQLLDLFGARSCILLLCHEEAMVACVHLQAEGETGHVGMLATEPALQGCGLGKQMLRHAESCARESFQASALRLSVLSARTELVAFYLRRGYVREGDEADYPRHAGVGEPLLPSLRVMRLMKPLVGVTEKGAAA